MLEDALNTPQSSDYVDAIVVELPKFTIMALRGPPEGIAEERVRIVNAKEKFGLNILLQ